MRLSNISSCIIKINFLNIHVHRKHVEKHMCIIYILKIIIFTVKYSESFVLEVTFILRYKNELKKKTV